MDAKELRIGNLVDLFGNIATIQSADFSGTGIAIKQGKPIPLTEEWLVKFGLTFSGYTSQDKAIYKINDEVWIVKNIVTKQFYLDEYELELKYVHQLQNLYFALTNTELKLKQ